MTQRSQVSKICILFFSLFCMNLLLVVLLLTFCKEIIAFDLERLTIWSYSPTRLSTLKTYYEVLSELFPPPLQKFLFPVSLLLGDINGIVLVLPLPLFFFLKCRSPGLAIADWIWKWRDSNAVMLPEDSSFTDLESVKCVTGKTMCWQ